MAQHQPTIPLPKARAIARGLWVIVGVLTVCSVSGVFAQRWLIPGSRSAEFAAFWSLDGEQNVPTFFSMLLMLGASVLLALTAAERRRTGGSDSTRWGLLSAGFLAMAYDEVCQVHEGLVAPVRHWLGLETYGLLYFAWVIPAAVLLLIITAVYWPFVRALPTSFRRSIVIAASLFLGGALVLECLTGLYVEDYGNLTTTYHILSTIEEVLELSGMIVFITALVRYRAAHTPLVQITFDA